ncbi:MAG TPA: SH3 domain-containing protein [Candidatus Binatia bacterium]|jgi:N-acetylmuramoyl-L-alanine amidase
MRVMSEGVKVTLILTLLLPLSGCKSDDSRQPAPQASAQNEPTRLYTTIQDVKVRSGPGTRYKIIAEIKADTRVNVAGQQGDWLRVVSKHGRPPGYIDQRFAKPAGLDFAPKSPRGIYTTTADISVRQGPGLHYKSVAKIDKDTQVTVVGAEGDWLKVQSKHGNPPGYIEKRYAERAPG